MQLLAYDLMLVILWLVLHLLLLLAGTGGSSSSRPSADGPRKRDSSTQAYDDAPAPAASSVPVVGTRSAAAAGRSFDPPSDAASASQPAASSTPAPAPPADSKEDALANPETWSRFDLGAALQELRSIREGVVRRGLRKLHIRWWHASVSRMQHMLNLAGIKGKPLELVKHIVNTCIICRKWQSPTPHPMTKARISEKITDVVQVDILFLCDGVDSEIPSSALLMSAHVIQCWCC